MFGKLQRGKGSFHACWRQVGRMQDQIFYSPLWSHELRITWSLGLYSSRLVSSSPILSRTGSRGQQPMQRYPDFLSTDTSASSWGSIPRRSQSACPGSDPGNKTSLSSTNAYLNLTNLSGTKTNKKSPHKIYQYQSQSIKTVSYFKININCIKGNW